MGNQKFGISYRTWADLTGDYPVVRWQQIDSWPPSEPTRTGRKRSTTDDAADPRESLDERSKLIDRLGPQVFPLNPSKIAAGLS
jgi:hypothetical protein